MQNESDKPDIREGEGGHPGALEGASADAGPHSPAPSKGDDIGDRMKAYEAAFDIGLDPTLPIYARIDGRSFSRFTRGMRRPFDPTLSEAMIETAARLVEHFHARIGYVQSDEISLVWLAEGDAQPLFGARVQKLSSVLAGFATAAFGEVLCQSDLVSYAPRLPHFDCRVLNVPTRSEACNMLLWREIDAYRNSVSMAAQSRFSHKQLHGKGRADMLEMLAGIGIDFEAEYPALFKRGTFVKRFSVHRTLTEAERQAIPDAHRPHPDDMFTRHETRRLHPPRFQDVPDREAFVFGDGVGRAPRPLAEPDAVQRMPPTSSPPILQGEGNNAD